MNKFLYFLAFGIIFSPLSSAHSDTGKFSSHLIQARTQGVKCDGISDDAPALNALFAEGFSTHTRVVLPPGICVIKSPLSWTLTESAIVGGGGGYTTQLLYEGPPGKTDILYIHDAQDALIDGISIASRTKMTGGAGLHLFHSRNITLHNITVTPLNPLDDASGTNVWNGIWLDSFDFVILTNFTITAQNDGLALSGPGTGIEPGSHYIGYQYDLFAGFGKLMQSKVNLHIGGGLDNLYFDSMMITSASSHNVLVDNSLRPFHNQEITFGTNVVNDQAGGAGYYINDTHCMTKNYGEIVIRGPVTAAHQDNIRVENLPNCELIIDSPYILSAQNHGIDLEDASARIVISDATLITRNQAGGIYGGFLNQNVYGHPTVLNNGNGNNPLNYINIAGTHETLPRFKVETLPSCTLGAKIYVINGRKPGESSGAGTGLPALCVTTARPGTQPMNYGWVSAFTGMPLSP